MKKTKPENNRKTDNVKAEFVFDNAVSWCGFCKQFKSNLDFVCVTITNLHGGEQLASSLACPDCAKSGLNMRRPPKT